MQNKWSSVLEKSGLFVAVLNKLCSCSSVLGHWGLKASPWPEVEEPDCLNPAPFSPGISSMSWAREVRENESLPDYPSCPWWGCSVLGVRSVEQECFRPWSTEHLQHGMLDSHLLEGDITANDPHASESLNYFFFKKSLCLSGWRHSFSIASVFQSLHKLSQ